MKATIGTKLMAGFLSISILLMVSNGITFYYMKNIQSSYSDLFERVSVILSNTQEVKFHSAQQISYVRGYLLSQDQELLEKLRASNQEVNQLISNTVPLIQVEEVLGGMTQLQGLNGIFKESADKVIRLAKEDLPAAITLAEAEAIPFGIEMSAQAIQIAALEHQIVEKASTENANNVETLIRTMMLASVTAVILAVWIGITISRKISKQIQIVSQALGQVAKGDLSVEEITQKSKDEIGDLVTSHNQMIRDVRNILTTIMHTSSSVTATSEELAAISEQSSRAIQLLAESGSELAQGSEKQVNAVIDSVAILEQFSAGLEQIEDNCRSMSNLSVISSENCEEGKIVVREALVQMKQIQDSVQDSATIINQLGQHSREIEGIVTFITDIANKTNMLAHNAAIESAHAGAHGRGFAVIAEEVRNLSEESKASTKQMASLLSLIQSESLEAVASMQENTSKIARGLEKTQQASESFDTIQASVENVTGKVQVVNRAVEEMSKASKQLVQAVELVQMIAEKGLHLSQQNSASAEEQLATMQELEASAQGLANLADEMQTLLAKFKL